VKALIIFVRLKEDYLQGASTEEIVCEAIFTRGADFELRKILGFIEIFSGAISL